MKWEYLRTYAYSDVGHINTLGALGWELVALYHDEAYFKRPLEDYGEEEEIIEEETTQEDPNPPQRVATAGELYANAYGFR